ncbi:hypothetical protein [Haloarcula hispanica]
MGLPGTEVDETVFRTLVDVNTLLVVVFVDDQATLGDAVRA